MIVDAILRVILVVVAISIIALIAYHCFQSYQRSGEAPIRWSWFLYLGWAIELGTRPIDFLQECQRLYGDVFGIIVGGNRMFIIADVCSANCVLKPHKELSWMEFHDSILLNFFGVSKFTA